MRITLAQVIPGVATALNQNQSSQRVLDYINRAQEELLNKARWVGTRIHYSICTTCNFITWPRQMETIEAIAVCGRPLTLHNEWYKFQDFGPWSRGSFFPAPPPGTQWRNHPHGVAIDRTDAISYADIDPTGNPKKLKVYSVAKEATGARILLQFHDINGNWIRSNDAAEGWVDGEFVTLSANGTLTKNTVGSWEGVQKDITNGTVRVTEYDMVTGLERNLALYEPSETNPTYRRTFLPGLGCQLNSTHPLRIQAVGKQRFISALNPRDYMMLQSSSAIISMAIAKYKHDNNQIQESLIYEQKAIQILDDELGAWVGYGTLQVPQFNMAFGMSQGEKNFI